MPWYWTISVSFYTSASGISRLVRLSLRMFWKVGCYPLQCLALKGWSIVGAPWILGVWASPRYIIAWNPLDVFGIFLKLLMLFRCPGAGLGDIWWCNWCAACGPCPTNPSFGSLRPNLEDTARSGRGREWMKKFTLWKTQQEAKTHYH